MENKRYIIECNEEELAAVYKGLEYLHVHMANAGRLMSDIKTVVDLHERLRPGYEEAVKRYQSSQNPPTEK